MREALQKRPVKGTTASVNLVNREKMQLVVNKQENFSSFHNFQYETKGVRVWKAYSIGKGKLVPYKEIFETHQGPTVMAVVDNQTFFPVDSARNYKEKPTDETEDDKLHECSEPGCSKTFESMEVLEAHMIAGDHDEAVESESVYDKIRKQWAGRFSTVTVDDEDPVNSEKSQLGLKTSKQQPQLSMGWALQKPRGGHGRFSPEVTQYLTTKFDLGEATGQKADPGQFATDMRKACDESGQRVFSRENWLNSNQVKSFFSRLTAKRRKGRFAASRESGIDTTGTTESDIEELMEEGELIESEQHRKETVQDILDDISVQNLHPIVNDSFDLCEYNKKQQLGRFSVYMLKSVCNHFEIVVKAKNTKTVLLEKLKEVLNQCSCVVK